MRLFDLRRSAIAKVAIVYAALIGFSLAILMGVILLLVTRDVKEQMREAIQQDVRGILEVYEKNGRQGLEQYLRVLGNSVEARRSLYLANDALGEKIVGNIAAMQTFDGWKEISISRDTKHLDHFFVFSTRLDDLVIFVGRRTHGIWEVQEAVLHSIAWALIILIPFSLFGGVVLARRAFQRVDDIGGIMDRFVGGDLSARAKVMGTEDEIDRLASNINGTLNRIERLVDDLKQVASDVAHDLRTPLGRLRHRLERTHEKLSGEVQQDVGDAIHEVDEILVTFDALVQIAEIDAGQAQSGFAELNLSAVVQEIFEDYVGVAEDNAHILQADIEPNLALRGSRRLIVQLLANVIENSIRHTPNGTRTKLSIRRTEDGIKVIVADNGPGIPELEREHVFKRFYRLDASRNTPGNGLGLSIVNAISELHGARISLSDNAPGLAVTIQFPTRGS